MMLVKSNLKPWGWARRLKGLASRTGERVPVSNGSVALEDIEEAMAEIKFSGR